MPDLQVKSSSGRESALEERSLRTFAEQLRGDLIQPDNAAYDDARHVYNAMIDRHPRFIAHCTDVSDLVLPHIVQFLQS